MDCHSKKDNRMNTDDPTIMSVLSRLHQYSNLAYVIICVGSYAFALENLVCVFALLMVYKEKGEKVGIRFC